MPQNTRKTNHNGQNGSKWTPVLVAVVGAFLGSAGTVGIYIGSPIGQKVARPDPYTGTQASALERRLNNHLESHPDHGLDVRVSRLEAQYEIILRNQDRILSRLN